MTVTFLFSKRKNDAESTGRKAWGCISRALEGSLHSRGEHTSPTSCCGQREPRVATHLMTLGLGGRHWLIQREQGCHLGLGLVTLEAGLPMVDSQEDQLTPCYPQTRPSEHPGLFF